MCKLKQHILVKIAAVVLMNAFLCLDISLTAGGLERLNLQFAQAITLDRSENIEVFNRLYKGNTHTKLPIIRLTIPDDECISPSQRGDALVTKYLIQREGYFFFNRLRNSLGGNNRNTAEGSKNKQVFIASYNDVGFYLKGTF
ncbi:MAG: hypothetical protein ABH952_07460 [Candidatus Omnitrophota bacterium]